MVAQKKIGSRPLTRRRALTQGAGGWDFFSRDKQVCSTPSREALGDDELAGLRTDFLGVMTQNCELIPYLTLGENLKLAYDISDNSKEKDSFAEAGTINFYAELLDALGLTHLQNEYPSSLSSGEIKRAAIARTLISKPEVIIMDEPTANLDRKNVRAVLRLLKCFSDQGSTVIISSHEQEAFVEADFKYELEYIT